MTESDKDIYRFGSLSLIVTLLLIGFIFTVDRCTSHKEPPQTEVRVDTVKVYMPVARDTVYLGNDTIRYTAYKDKYHTLYKTDTLIKVDTVGMTVSLPISQKTYQDSTYTAVVSGYSPNLDYIEVYQKTTTRVFPKWKQPRLSVGAGVGYYLTPKGLQPGIGITLQYNILNIK